jgi:hypothetical protein
MNAIFEMLTPCGDLNARFSVIEIRPPLNNCGEADFHLIELICQCAKLVGISIKKHREFRLWQISFPKALDAVLSIEILSRL